jgi:CheY-like chemotaxis protein
LQFGRNTHIVPYAINLITMDLNLEGKTILVAEDNADSYKLVETILRSTKAKLIWAETGAEALFFMKHPELNISAVIMDVQMPELDGIETTRALRQIFPDMPVIMLSSDQSKLAEADSLALFDSKIKKPVSRNVLFSALSCFFSPQ